MNQTRELELEIKGIELSREFYIRIGKPVLEELFPEYMEKAAVGLVGEGSECYGFDDILSTDHDYGPGFCVWLDREDYHKAGGRMNQIYEALPREYRGIAERLTRVESDFQGTFGSGSLYQSTIWQWQQTERYSRTAWAAFQR